MPDAGPATHADAMASDEPLVRTAVLRAADALGIRGAELGEILGVSAATVSRLRGSGRLEPDGKPWELALQFLRIYRAASGLYGGDTDYIGRWLRAEHADLRPCPLDAMKTVTGLVGTAEYLDAMRGRA